MRVLQINKYHYPKGGADKYYLELSKLLEANGHEVVHFAMRGKKNLPSPYQKYFVSEVDFSRPRLDREGLRALGRMFYSFEARKQLEALIQATKPDIAHIHNIYHQISPSILGILKKHNIPVVMTVEDYALIAPNYTLYHDGAICERTKKYKYWRAIAHRCVKGSRVASIVSAMEMSFHKLLRLYERGVACFIAPSRFVADILSEYGQDVKKINVVHHFTDAVHAIAGKETGEYMLYVGRLSQEKGIPDLLNAMKYIPGIPLKIVGVGPEEERLRELAQNLLLSSQVTFEGMKTGEALWDMVRGARAVVVPSAWYEVFGLVLIEAYALGRPVVASRIGGMTELVEEGKTGFLTEPSNPKDLAAKIKWMWEHPSEARVMGEYARAKAVREFNPEKHYEEIMEIYREEIGR